MRMRMHPQSELENYKLQVELLQEKLHRSEDNRQELEEKLEQIMKKRNEHERTLRSRSQQNYQQFLDEQKKRNERNRKLVEMLERTDQQAAALSARSERLKMMKLQYELYFSKLVQTYSMKTLQSIPAASLLPMHEQTTSSTSTKTDEAYPSKNAQTPLNNNTPEFQRVPLPVVVPFPNGQHRFHPSWTFASAPPGVLIALPNNATLTMSDNVENKKNQTNFCFDYSQFPIGYLQAATTAIPMQYNVGQSYLQQPHEQKPSIERHTRPLFAADDDIKQSRPHLEFKGESNSPFSFSDVKTNEAFLKKTQPESYQLISNVCSHKPKNYDDSKINEDKENGQENQNFTRVEPMSNKDLPGSHQSLKDDKLLNIKPNNSFQQGTLAGSIVPRGNIPNTIDFRTDDDDEYIKYIKEMKETYEKNVPIPISVAPQEHNIDNITTTLQIQKTQKIDETNVRDDEKINDMEDNEKNTSSASVPLDGKCSIESIGDEALPKKPLEYKTQQNTSNTPARNIDPTRDTKQITLFNGTKNSEDESTRASNRSTAFIDGVGENKESTESTRIEPSYRPLHFDKKEKMSIENIETAIYGELLTKTGSSTSNGLPDNPRGNGSRDEEIDLNPHETKEYEFDNLGQDLYKQEQEAVIESEQQGASYVPEIEQIEELAANNADSYNYTDDNVAPLEDQQQYDMQNVGYTDQPQEYSATNQDGNVAQQEYPYTENGELLPKENYESEYQNYDASQYQGEYDPNAYQYDYGETQYGDGSQAQYDPEAYNQEYQQSGYTDEYANYEQVENNVADVSNEPYPQVDHTPMGQEISENKNEEDFQAENEALQTEIDTVEPDENEPVQSLGPPTSILSTDKNSDLATKKKKRVNFVESETDESSTVPKPGGTSSESDFDFSAN